MVLQTNQTVEAKKSDLDLNMDKYSPDQNPDLVDIALEDVSFVDKIMQVSDYQGMVDFLENLSLGDFQKFKNNIASVLQKGNKKSAEVFLQMANFLAADMDVNDLFVGVQDLKSDLQIKRQNEDYQGEVFPAFYLADLDGNIVFVSFVRDGKIISRNKAEIDAVKQSIVDVLVA